MSEFSDSTDGNLIHLDGPGLIPGKLVDSFYNMVESGNAPDEKKKLFRERFENDYGEYPAYLWESNGEAFSFFIYRVVNDKADILWCHQLQALFPIETFFRPAMEAFIDALIEDIKANKITSQFSSWSSIVGVDLLSSVCPEFGFERFDIEIMEASTNNEVPDYILSENYTCVHWEIDRTDEAVDLMVEVGDSYLKYIDVHAEDCREFIIKTFDPGLSRMVLNSDSELVSFINFNRRGWIGQIFTKAAYQNRGIGKYLLSLAFQELKDKKVPKSSLAVLSDNAGAKRLYKEFGFEDLYSSPTWALLVDSDSSNLPK